MPSQDILDFVNQSFRAFEAEYPQFQMSSYPDKAQANSEALMHWFENNTPWIFREADETNTRIRKEYPTLLREAFVALLSRGKIWVDAGGAVITGRDLQQLSAIELERLCRPVTQTSKVYRKEFDGIEEQTGFAPDVAAAMSAKEWKAYQLAGEDAINEFKRRRPEYVDTTENGKRIDRWLTQHGLTITLANLNNAFDSLYSAGQIGRNADALPLPEPNRFERKYYVGQQNPAVTPPTGGSKIVHRKTWTNLEIKNMTADQYQQMLSDPDFVAAVNTSVLGR